MSENSTNTLDLKSKIARLVAERGWKQADFVRISQLSPQTVYQIMSHVGERKLQNATIHACARALGLTVTEMVDQPLERLLPRMHAQEIMAGEEERLRRLFEHATQPELKAWMERNPERARNLSDSDIDELLSLQGTGGPMTALGVEHFVTAMERRKRLQGKVAIIAGTEFIDLLEQMVDLMYDKVQPYRDKTDGG